MHLAICCYYYVYINNLNDVSPKYKRCCYCQNRIHRLHATWTSNCFLWGVKLRFVWVACFFVNVMGETLKHTVCSMSEMKRFGSRTTAAFVDWLSNRYLAQQQQQLKWTVECTSCIWIAFECCCVFCPPVYLNINAFPMVIWLWCVCTVYCCNTVMFQCIHTRPFLSVTFSVAWNGECYILSWELTSVWTSILIRDM